MKRGDRAVRANLCIGGDIFRLIPIARKVKCENEQHPVVLSDQPVERRSISGTTSREQKLFVSKG